MSSNLILGTVQFGMEYGINNRHGKPSTEEVNDILKCAFQNKVYYLDTADNYGESQKRIGNFHSNFDEKFNIISKFDFNEKNILEKSDLGIEHKVNLLNVDNIYCQMFHSYNDLKTFNDCIQNKLKSLKKRNIIKKIGVSIYTNQEFENALNYDLIDLVQIPFNLLDNFNIKGDLIKKAKSKNIEIHARSVFLQGLFFKDHKSLKNSMKPMIPYLKKITNICNKYSKKIEDIALNYVYNTEGIDKVIIGVDNKSQLVKNIKCIKSKIENDLINEINDINVIEEQMLLPYNWH